MGMDLVVTFTDRPPEWAGVADRLAGRGWAVQMRMIDGELCFPDAVVPDTWRELRVAASGAMVTVRRGDKEVRLVAWGNADDAQLRLWQALAWAFAAAGGGRVRTDGGELDADTFAAAAGL
jgi:hypothetical protein